MSSFWERRKAAVAEEARVEEEARVAAVQEAEEQALADKPDEVLLQEAGLKEPEALESAEEVQDFLKAALPQRLKTRALRRLWRLNPVLANLDGLVDYGEDYTDAALVVENMQTVYQVGKGMFDKAVEAAKEAEAAEVKARAAAEESEAEAAEEPAGDLADNRPQDLPEPPSQPAQSQPSEPDQLAPQDLTDDEEPALPATARRMRFHFETTGDSRV